MTPGAPSKRELRLTGAAFGIVLAAVGAFMLSRHGRPAPFVLVVSAVALMLATFLPTLLRPLVLGGRAIARPIIWLLTRGGLTLVFYAIVTPIAVIGRVFGSGFSDSDFSKRRESYWIERGERAKQAGEYEKQY